MNWPRILPITGAWLASAGGILAFSFQLADSYTLPKLVCMAAGALLMLLPWLWDASEEPRLVRHAIPYWLILGAACIFSVDETQSFIGYYRDNRGIVALMLVGLLYGGAAGSGLRLRDVLPPILAATAATGLYAIVQRVGLDPFAVYALPTGGRVSGAMGSPVYLGALLAFALPLARLTGRPDPLRVVAWALGLAAVYLSGSRGAWLGLGAALVYCGRGALAQGERLRTLVLALPLTAAIAFTGSGRPTSDSDLMRFEGFLAGWRAFLEHPWLGWGPDTFLFAFQKHATLAYVQAAGYTDAVNSHAHNLPLQVLVTTGLLGFLAASWLAWRVWKSLEGQEGVRTALVALGVQAMVNPVPIEVWGLAALVVGAAENEEGQEILWARPRLEILGVLFALLLAAEAVVLFGWSAWADLAARRAYVQAAGGDFAATASELNTAIARAPWEREYRRFAIDTLWAVARDHRKALKTDPLEEAVLLAKEGALLAPADPHALAYYGAAVKTLALHGGEPWQTITAKGVLAEAGRLYPVSRAILEHRIHLAWARGETSEMRGLYRTWEALTTATNRRDEVRQLFRCAFDGKPWAQDHDPRWGPKRKP